MKKNSQETELKWYEKRQGIKPKQKQSQEIKREAAALKYRQKEQDRKRQESYALRSRPQISAEPKEVTAFRGECTGSLFDINKVPLDAQKVIEEFDKVIDSTHPLNSKQRAMLTKDIRELSHYLTDERGERRLGYMNRTQTLSAYVHYYLWWNLVRLTRLFASLPEDFFRLKDGSVCLDIGSGPLTVPLALYLARSDLRNIKLTFYCMDISKEALSIGENLFLTVASRLGGEPWKIIRVKGELGTTIKDKSDLITCANVFNEIVQDNQMPPDYLAKKYTEKLLSYINSRKEDTAVLLIEPGVPQSSRFVSLMRDALMRKGYRPLSPCTHTWECPMDGKKGGKWCNFAFSTQDAPQSLKKLSESSRLPKERAVLSFVASVYDSHLTDRGESEADKDKTEDTHREDNRLSIRIASDPIKLPGSRTGYYACSSKGLLLVITQTSLLSGQNIIIKNPKYAPETDSKSGALIVNI